jgi:hypothetical protein
MLPNGRSFDSFSTGYKHQGRQSCKWVSFDDKHTFAREIQRKQTDINMPVIDIW